MKADPSAQVRLLDVQQLDSRIDVLRHQKATLPEIAELAGVVSAAMPLASVVVLVCGASVDVEALRRACARLPFGARALAVVAQAGLDSPELRRIADADVVTVGALDQLPLALQRVLA